MVESCRYEGGDRAVTGIWFVKGGNNTVLRLVVADRGGDNTWWWFDDDYIIKGCVCLTGGGPGIEGMGLEKEWS